MEVDPPSVLPCGSGMRLPLVRSVGSELNCHANFGLKITLMKPAGSLSHGWLSGGPASSTQTLTFGSSLKRAATMEPAAPLPTIT